MTIIMPLRRDRDTVSCAKCSSPDAQSRSFRGNVRLSEVTREREGVFGEPYSNHDAIPVSPTAQVEHFSHATDADLRCDLKANRQKGSGFLHTIGSYLVAGLFGILFVSGIVNTGSTSDYSPSREERAVSSLNNGASPAYAYRFPTY